MKNIYSKIYSDRKNLGQLQDSPRIRKMLEMADGLELENRNILDIGCYDGTFLSSVRNRNNHFFGLEASDWGFQKAQEKGIETRQFFFDDQAPLPFADNFFELVVAGEIIEHIYDTDFFLSEIRRVLRPGGKLLLSTPNIASLGRRLLLLLGKSPIIEDSPNRSDSSGHIRYFTRMTLANLLEKNHFRVLERKADCINFSQSGAIRSVLLADTLPSFGTSIIFLAEK